MCSIIELKIEEVEIDKNREMDKSIILIGDFKNSVQNT